MGGGRPVYLSGSRLKNLKVARAQSLREVWRFSLAAPRKELPITVIPRLTYYGHVESYNERLASMMVTGVSDYFSVSASWEEARL